MALKSTKAPPLQEPYFIHFFSAPKQPRTEDRGQMMEDRGRRMEGRREGVRREIGKEEERKKNVVGTYSKA